MLLCGFQAPSRASGLAQAPSTTVEEIDGKEPFLIATRYHKPQMSQKVEAGSLFDRTYFHQSTLFHFFSRSKTNRMLYNYRTWFRCASFIWRHECREWWERATVERYMWHARRKRLEWRLLRWHWQFRLTRPIKKATANLGDPTPLYVLAALTAERERRRQIR